MSEQEYSAYVKQVTPTHSTPLNAARAFLVGGLICCLGQAITNGLIGAGIEKEAAGTWTSVILVGAAILATGFNWFGSLVKFGGAGALVPITGFSNSITAPALEFKSEGFILGLGAKMFVIAGPVLVYGITASIVYGLILYLFSIV